MIIIQGIVIIVLAIALVIEIVEVRSVFKSQLKINIAFNELLGSMIETDINSRKRIISLEEKVAALEKSIELTDKGLCIMYSTLKDHETNSTSTKKRISKR